jgi:Fe-S-cluster containining protein
MTVYSAIQAAVPFEFQHSLNKKLATIVNDNATLKSKIKRLQALTSEARQPTAASVPCKKGCCACCYIQVEMSQAEADLIGDAIGRPAVRLPPGNHTTSKDLLGRPNTPCPFLDDGACAIYEVRPVVCRNFAIADIDNLLCSFENMALAAAKDPRAINVPMLHAGPIFAAYRELNYAKKQSWADIRQYFPYNQ